MGKHATGPWVDGPPPKEVGIKYLVMVPGYGLDSPAVVQWIHEDLLSDGADGFYQASDILRHAEIFTGDTDGKRQG